MLNWDLFANFTEKEMACRHCGECEVTADLMEALQDLRDLIGPLVVSSAYRCKDHPVEIVKKAPGTGAHCRGLAVDIVCENSSKRHQILKAAMPTWLGVGVSSKFIHLDRGHPEATRPALWTY